MSRGKQTPPQDYIAIVQCHLVKQRCSGYFGGFAGLEPGRAYRTLTLTCGGCCGRALHRKLGHLVRQARDKEKVEKSRIVVQLSSCIVKDNYHGPACPHLAYLKELIAKLGLAWREGTKISAKAEA